MKHNFFVVCLFVLFVLCLSSCNDNKDINYSNIEDLIPMETISEKDNIKGYESLSHIEDMSEVFSILYESKEPVFVYFYSIQCSFCDRMKSSMEKLAEEYGEKLKMYSVEVSFGANIAMMIGIGSTPTYCVIENGQDYTKLGACSYNELKDFVRKYTRIR